MATITKRGKSYRVQISNYKNGIKVSYFKDI